MGFNAPNMPEIAQDSFKNTTTTICCMTPSKKRTVKAASLILLNFGILEKFFSDQIQ
jgi:hypothetical protein